MSEFYKIFYALENEMRDLIESAMSERKGIDWWDTWVPQAVRDNVKKNHEREASEGLTHRSDRMIDYTTFGELGHVEKRTRVGEGTSVSVRVETGGRRNIK